MLPEEDLVDPALMSASVAAAKALSGGEAEASSKLLQRLLGPTADVLGDAMAQYTSSRIQNIGRIADRTMERTQGRAARAPHPRVAHRILEEGSFADNELMVEYLSGVLVAEQEGGSQEDEAVAWTALIGSMSTRQLRLHFLLYREWATLLLGRDGLELGRGAVRSQVDLEMNYDALLEALGLVREQAPNQLASSMAALSRLDLISDYAMGAIGEDEQHLPTQWEGHARVRMSLAGMQLYGWALGQADVSPNAFVTLGGPMGAIDLPPRVAGALLFDSWNSIFPAGDGAHP